MTHPCFHDTTALIDHLTTKDRTALEECVLHTLIDQATAIDRLIGLLEDVARADQRFKRLVANQRQQAATEHQAQRDHDAVRIATLARQLNEARKASHELSL